METKKILKELQEKHFEYIKYIDELSKENYEYSYQGKWNAGQHLDHIFKSVAVLSKALGYPKWLLKYKFGKANRPSRTKDALESRYNEKLKGVKGTPTPSRFQPNEIPYSEKENAFQKLKNEVDKLNKKANKYSKKNLETCILPHPLLGKLTITEMLYFTSIHVVHHQELIKKSLINE